MGTTRPTAFGIELTGERHLADAKRSAKAHAISDLAELFSLSRPTVYRTLGRQPPAK
jgi:hypothetical protein